MSLSTRTVARQFPDWNLAQCRAYRAGALAGIRGKPIRDGFEYGGDDLEEDLTLFFLRGYADAIGDDAKGEEWFDEISDWRIEERWWEETGSGSADAAAY